MVAVIAIGLFALPSTFSYSGSMHTFKQIDPTSEATINTFCLKCHTGDISTQLAASDNGLYQGGVKIHSSIGCQGCHQITRTAGANGYGVEAASTEHAARLPTCLDCHLATGILMQIGDAGTEIRVTSEAHQNFKDPANVDNDIECIGCHTDATRTGSVTTSMTSAPVTISGLTIG